jgi:hypothetical protein
MAPGLPPYVAAPLGTGAPANQAASGVTPAYPIGARHLELVGRRAA